MNQVNKEDASNSPGTHENSLKETFSMKGSRFLENALTLESDSSIYTILRKYLSRAKKQKLYTVYYKVRKKVTDAAYSYSYLQLVEKLIDLGVKPGDTLMVHSSFNPFNGFKGDPLDIIRALKEIVNPDDGTILMLSLPYGGSTYKYLKKTKVFDVGRTVSHMGLISEVFRRQKGVLRSFHPTHPFLAYGALADWFVRDHEKCLYGCGPGSPFEKLTQTDSKVLFFDVPVRYFTFFHYLEHLAKDRLPFPLYDDEIFEVEVVTPECGKIQVKAKAFSSEAIERRNPDLMWQKMWSAKKVKDSRIGMTDLRLSKVSDVLFCAEKMIRNDELFYKLD